MQNQADISTNIYLKLTEASLAKLIHGLKELESAGIKYEIVETIPIKLEPKNIPFTSKDFGRKGEEVLQLLYEGCSYTEISERANISINGVRYYIKRIYKAFGVKNAREAIKIYRNYTTT